MSETHVTSITSHDPLIGDCMAGTAGFMEMYQNPSSLDQSLRAAVQMCWMLLPKERRTVEELEKQVRRLVERALTNFAEDKVEFGESPSDIK